MQPIFLLNTLGRQKTEFIPITQGKVGIYSCGPTVYDRASIGNLRAYVFSDVLRRVFEVSGYQVTHVMNITDVGHLTDDASSGEDKMLIAAEKEKKTAWQIAEEYTQLFVHDLEKLNVELPQVMPKATDHIADQIAFIEAMEVRGFTYITSDGVYFDTAKLPDYGKLSGQKAEEKEEGARVGVNKEKRNPSDFALWKFSKDGEVRQMEWDSPWGRGFPGWHIECSAMSEKYLGVPFDIHTGGIDHIAVHHENEIAQTSAARGVLEANWWLHNEFLLVDGGKMSKSLGNTYSLDDLAAKDIRPLSYRYFLLGAHYKTPLNFTWEAVGATQNALQRLVATVREWPEPTVPDAARVQEFMTRLNDDLDTAGGLALLWQTVNDQALDGGVKSATILAFDKVFGLNLDQVVAKPVQVPEKVQALINERAEARRENNWTRSDELRDEIAALGFVVEDRADGQRIRTAQG